MTPYETVFQRRSVRKYDMTPLDADTLDKLEVFVAAARNIDGQKLRFKFVPAAAVGDNRAPHYILAYGNSSAEYINAGFVLQQTDLYLQSVGLGSLWLGAAKPSDVNEKDDFCIMLAFGKTDVPLRTSANDFKRLPISDISETENKIAEAVRLAPSAVNFQPWKLRFEKGKIFVDYVGRGGVLKLVLKKKIQRVDIGIAAAIAVAAAEEEGKTVSSVKAVGDAKTFGVEISV
ncbi:MAG: nitroreductase [Clostridiaceae bacterium]|jgi:nitroreductase|nr:nitroreductase [Clostridiaceae bacterium]